MRCGGGPRTELPRGGGRPDQVGKGTGRRLIHLAPAGFAGLLAPLLVLAQTQAVDLRTISLARSWRHEHMARTGRYPHCRLH
jgi:hypothetical protein